ncbi:helix-turn-helix domain-containing protein [Lactiplantibacillus argentoratensis]|uniref:Helix-turn-helix transcriptional regulator n=1 Tax=Lactiplantibacillus argentoratensis TaxID=271881 RepID=A0ABS5UGG7_9LACO|nr:helix-turn-helix transcriptional regulator [Lactiplantibacillus argentoratensis]MBT1137671.1 helix-turn-helix transcriptional regulator [Lactiplantibacillus argentoratensis]MBT1140529.1 helix-turn-helix transcriptional regulator [Lactiplantibacillus argentoratensis]
MTEEKLINGAKAITTKIKIRLLERDMSQVELAKLIGEGPTQVNRAIHADMSPKSIDIRQKIYRVLNIEN